MKDLEKHSEGNFSEMSKVEFLDFAKGKISHVLPGQDHYEIQVPDNSHYMYFPAFDYFRHGIIDQGVISDLLSGAKLLSVGAGPAYYERVLADGFGVPAENIHVADISQDELKAGNFPAHIFDMTKPWPKLPTTFDYIIFPESFGVAHMFLPGWEKNHVFNAESMGKRLREELFDKNRKTFDSKKAEIRMTILERGLGDGPKQSYQTIENAIGVLAPDGEIRMLGHTLTDDEAEYVILRVTKEHPEMYFEYNSNVLILKKLANAQ